jgi:hypothetical protein
MVAELVLAVFGTIDLCIKLGKKTVKTYRAFRDADTAIADRLLVVEAIWSRVEVQLSTLRNVSHILTEEAAQTQYLILQRLHSKLQQADTQLELPESRILRRLKHVFVKKELDALIKDLEDWQRRFDPTWYFVVLIKNSAIDAELAKGLADDTGNAAALKGSTGNSGKGPLQGMTALRQAIQQTSQGSDTSSAFSASLSSINLDASGLADASITPIPYSSARIVIRKGSTKMLVAETVETLESSEMAQVKRLVENLARRLKHVDADTFHLLQCYGILKHRDDPASPRAITGIDMIYRAPSGQSARPTSLRELLLRQQQQPQAVGVSVSAKVRLAKQLAQSVCYVHTCDFVHKGIRPENILVFPGDAATNSTDLGASYLIGFNQFRESSFQTNLRGDASWHRNLYRHPQRQGRFVVDRYVMQHDIYSLGVCLLEIGLWGSFVWYPESGGNDAAPMPGHALKMTLSDADFDGVQSAATGHTKDHLVRLARMELAARMGDLYTDIVVACLTCLDADNAAFGPEEELQDEDGILVGVRYVEKIVLRMEDISV